MNKDVRCAIETAKRLITAIETGERACLTSREESQLFRQLGWNLETGTYKSSEVKTTHKKYPQYFAYKFANGGKYGYPHHYWFPFQVKELKRHD